MIYLDTSVALAHILDEVRVPPDRLWSETLTSSRLLEYEMWNRIHARGLAESHGDLVRRVLCQVSLLELDPEVLDRARHPFPVPVRTLDAMHLATLLFLQSESQRVLLASYDVRMVKVARRLKIPLYRL